MLKKHKDLISIYMLRNAFGTFLAALLAFLISIMNYYQCDLSVAIQRLIVYDTYTLLYVLLLWVFDYIVFEMSKIVYDIYEEKVTFIPCIVLLVIAVVVFFVPILDFFQYNLCFLCLLIILRMMKEMWKRTPELFTWVHQLKKTKSDGLK